MISPSDISVAIRVTTEILNAIIRYICRLWYDAIENSILNIQCLPQDCGIQCLHEVAMNPNLTYNDISWNVGVAIVSPCRHPLMVRELGEARGRIFVEEKRRIANQDGNCYREEDK